MIEQSKLTSGICSITLKECSAEQVIEFLIESGLDAVEWWGGEHVPPGEVEIAREVGRLTREAGKLVSSYGSYYRVGVSPTDGLSFKTVLDSACALEAPTIRVWAGVKNREDCSADELAAVIADAHRIADLAADKGVSITFEFHGGSLTNNNANALRLSEELAHPNIFFSWQPPHGFTQAHCCEGLLSLLGRLSTVHVYHWTIGAYEDNLYSEAEQVLKWPGDYHRHPLEDGHSRWSAYIQIVRQSTRAHSFLLEFVQGDSLEQARCDAKTLEELLSASKSHIK
jgi:sugar phosphate isomerase/epimerase